MSNNYTKDEILKIAEEKDVRFIRLQFTDLFGQLKNIEIPRSQLKKALDNQMMFDGSSIEGFARVEESDMYFYPDLSTWLILPSNIEYGCTARLICDVYLPNGQPFEGDPRGTLKRALKEAKEMGYTVYVGPEPEFFLFKKNDDNILIPNDKGGYLDIAPLDEGDNCRREIVLTLEEMEFEMEASHHENANGQHEVDFKYEDALKTADNIQTFKLVVKNIAEKHGLVASFMPKPIFGVAGSGMHCNMSLFHHENGKNAFFDVEGAEGLSATAYRFIAGILKNARANAAITNPTVNSYKRLVSGYEAPVYTAWSTSNRTCMVRIPSARGNGTRVEARNPDPSANPYLCLAVLVKSGLMGIKQNLQAPGQHKENLYHMSNEDRIKKGIDILPESLSEALNEMRNNKYIEDIMGTYAFNRYIDAKQKEYDMYRMNVSDWEIERYMNI